MRSSSKLISTRNFLDERGRLVAWEDTQPLGFDIRRVYTITEGALGVVRGYHAHKALKQVLICLGGAVQVRVEDKRGRSKYELNEPYEGLALDGLVWREYEFTEPKSILLVLASELYSRDDYIHDYEEFRNYLREL